MTMQWRHDKRFDKEVKKFAKKHPTVGAEVGKAKKLLARQFGPLPERVIEPGKMLRVYEHDGETGYEVWKLKMSVADIQRPQNWPWVWFLKQGERITFLSMATDPDF